MAKRLADWLIDQGEHLVFYTEEKITYDYIRQINPDYLISYNYKYLISKDILDFLKGNAINLHISYLPYGRGSYPIVWNILENNPLGVTIHYIDEGIDTGDIIVQKEVLIDKDKETLRTAYEILHKEIQQLFKDNWQRIKNKEISPLKQSHCGGGTIHYDKEFKFFGPFIEGKGWDTPIKVFRENFYFKISIRG